jgi:phage gpG-like protein
MSFGSNEFDYKSGIKINLKTLIRWTPEPVIKAAQSAGEKALAKFASFVWTAAHQSIRYGKYRGKGIYKRRKGKPSPPGTAMGFGTGFMRDSLVVQRIDNRELHIGFYRGGWVAELHEWGGVRTRTKSTKGAQKHYSDERWYARYPERPTMRLALEKSESDFERKFPEEFAKYFGAGGRATIGESV